MKFKYDDTAKQNTWISDKYKIVEFDYVKMGNVLKYDPHFKVYYDGYLINSTNHKELIHAVKTCKTHSQTEVIYDEN